MQETEIQTVRIRRRLWTRQGRLRQLSAEAFFLRMMFYLCKMMIWPSQQGKGSEK